MKNCFDTFYVNTNLLPQIITPRVTKNANNPSCFDPILTNRPKSFFKTEAVFPGLSDFYKLILSVFKLHFSKAKTKEKLYRNFKDSKEYNFNRDLQNRLSADSAEKYAAFEKFLKKTCTFRDKSCSGNSFTIYN